MLETTNTPSAVPSEIFIGVALLLLSLVVILILRYYLPLRTTPAYLLVPIFFALWLPMGIILLVPIDLNLSLASDDVRPRFLLVSWRITYWLTFALTWFILPILAEYSDSGYREPKDKVLYSLRENAQYHAIVFGSGILGLIYVFISYGFSVTSLKGLVMALAYCWGLVLAIYLMGHGLVAIPRRLFRGASISGRLRRIQAQAPRLHEKLEDAETKLDDLEAQVSELSRRKVGSARDFQDWIEELVDLSNMPESQPVSVLSRGLRDESRIVPTIVTEKYMADLTRRLVRARHSRVRYLNEWNRLVRDAVETQAILDSAASKKLDFGRSSAAAGFWDRITIFTPFTRYLFYFHLVPYLMIFLGGCLALASVCIILSETVKVAQPSLSVIRYTVVYQWSDDDSRVGFFREATAALWIMYMCVAALTSITEVKVWRGRALVRRNTAHESAFWYASQVARLSIPLSYNFITFLPRDVYQRTEFYHFLGQLIDLTPLGKWFDYLFPAFVLVPVFATLFGLYGRVRRLFGFGDIVDDDDGDGAEGGGDAYGTGSWREGRDLIERELNGTSVRGRRAALARTGSPISGAAAASHGRTAPVLSVPAARSSPLGPRSPTRPVANTSARRTAAGPSASQGGANTDPEDDNFFQSLGHRVRNTIDTIDTPKWMQGIKKPKWMGGAGDDDEGGGSRPGPLGRTNSDVRRWFGGREGRIRL